MYKQHDQNPKRAAEEHNVRDSKSARISAVPLKADIAVVLSTPQHCGARADLAFAKNVGASFAALLGFKLKPATKTGFLID